MADRFDKFTERARRVLTLAQEEAHRFNHNYIGTEHILLGLVREGDGVAAKVLANLGVELNKVRSAVEFIIGRGDRTVLGEIGLTPRAKKVIELARSTFWLSAAWTTLRVPMTLFVTASTMFTSINGTCLCAAAWKTTCG